MANGTTSPQSTASAAMAQRFTPRDPPFVFIYGASGRGKTTEQGFAFPTAEICCQPGALDPIRAVCGYDPRERRDVRTVQDAIRVIGENHRSKTARPIVIDDFSWVAEQTWSELEHKLSGYKLFGALRKLMLDFRDVARYAGVPVMLSCWESPPAIKSGKPVLGGPKLPSDMPEMLPALADFVLRVGYDPARKPWPGVYRVGFFPDFITKDRWNVCPDPAPMNLAEILRAAGYNCVPRLAGLEWQEEYVERLASALLAAPQQESQLCRGVFDGLVDRGARPEHASWVTRDGRDRAVLRRARADNYTRFGL